MAIAFTPDDDRRLVDIEKKLDRVLDIVNGLVTKQSLTEQRVTNLEAQPAQTRSAWSFGLSGCSTALMAASICISAIGMLTGVAGLIIAIVR